MRMQGRESLLENRDGILKQRNRFGISARTIHQVTKVMARQSHVGRIGAQQLLLNGQCPPVMFLGLLTMAASGQKCGQIVQVRSNLVMVRPVGGFEECQRAAVNGLALVIPFQAIE